MTQASLIIPSRGGRDRLPRLFAALEQQTHRDLEVVVVIDGDADDSESLARSWARHIPLTTIVLPDNRGRSVALNTGFGAAEGQGVTMTSSRAPIMWPGTSPTTTGTKSE